MAEGATRHFARLAGSSGLPGANNLGYVPSTPEELQDEAHAQTATALAASVAVGGPLGRLAESVLPEAALAGSGGVQTLLRGLGNVVKGFAHGATIGTVYGALRPTRPDETRLDAVTKDALGFGGFEAAAVGLIGAATTLAQRRFPSPTAQNLARASDAVFPRVTERQVPMWDNDGMYVVGQMPDGRFRAVGGTRINTPRGFGIGTTPAEAIANVKGLPETPHEIPTGTVSETGAGVSLTPLNSPPNPEFTGLFGRMRYFSQVAFGDLFADVRKAGFDRAHAALSQAAASQMATGYTGLMVKDFSGIARLSIDDRTLLGDWFNAREGARLRGRLDAQIASTTDPNELTRLQSAREAVRIPELTQAQQQQFAARSAALQPIVKWLDERLQPMLEAHKLQTGLSLGQFHAADLEAPVLSLVPKFETAEATEAATVTGVPAVPAGAGSIPSRYRALKTSAALGRTGTGTYENDISTMVDSWLHDVMPKTTRRAMMEEITKSPGVRQLGERERPDPGMVTLPFQAADLKSLGADVNGRWQVPPVLKNAYDKLATRDVFFRSATGNRAVGLLDLATQLQLAAPVEASSHAWRMVSGLAGVPGVGNEIAKGWGRAINLFPSLGPKGTAIASMVHVGSDPAAMAEGISYLARIGALSGRPLAEEAGQGMVAALRRGVPLLDAMPKFLFGMPQFGPGLAGWDTRVRLMALQAVRQFAKDAGHDATDAEVRQFVNGMAGTYGTQMQTNTLALLRKSRLWAFGSYQSSAIPREAERMAGPFLPGVSGGTGLPMSIWGNLPKSRQLLLRAETAWRGVVGDAVVRSAITKASTGYWPWDPQHLNWGDPTKIGIGATGTGDDQKFVYARGNMLDPGITRAWRTTGLRALATETMAGVGPLAQRVAQGLQQATTDFGNVILGIASPWIRFAGTALLNTQPYMTQPGEFLHPAPLGLTAAEQWKNQISTALTQANPIVGQAEQPGSPIRAIQNPLARTGAFLANISTPGISIGPPASQVAGMKEGQLERRVQAYVTQRATDILKAPSDSAHDAMLDDVTNSIENSSLPDAVKGQALSELRRQLASRPKAASRRAARAAP